MNNIDTLLGPSAQVQSLLQIINTLIKEGGHVYATVCISRTQYFDVHLAPEEVGVYLAQFSKEERIPYKISKKDIIIGLRPETICKSHTEYLKRRWETKTLTKELANIGKNKAKGFYEI